MPDDYDYIQRQYGKIYTIGQQVRHTVTGKTGFVQREDKGAEHYVQVRFDDRGFDLSCHPDELEVIEPEEDFMLTLAVMLGHPMVRRGPNA